jgi:hypothetical protein
MKLPAPDLAKAPRFGPELTIVDVIYSEDKQVRVSITKDRQNVYRIHPERWDVSDMTVIGHAYWNPWGHSDSLVGDLETARIMANEALRTTPRSTVIPDHEA